MSTGRTPYQEVLRLCRLRSHLQRSAWLAAGHVQYDDQLPAVVPLQPDMTSCAVLRRTRHRKLPAAPALRLHQMRLSCPSFQQQVRVRLRQLPSNSQVAVSVSVCVQISGKEAVSSLLVQPHAVSALDAVSPDGKWLISAASCHVLQLWQLDECR